MEIVTTTRLTVLHDELCLAVGNQDDQCRQWAVSYYIWHPGDPLSGQSWMGTCAHDDVTT